MLSALLMIIVRINSHILAQTHTRLRSEEKMVIEKSGPVADTDTRKGSLNLFPNTRSVSVNFVLIQ